MAKKGLGKGLDALLKTDEVVILNESSKENIVELKISEVEPNKAQPRRVFDEESLLALSESIKEYGVLSPIIVSKNDNGFYTIIAGERRWRASKMARLSKIPAIIKNSNEKEIMEIALIENLQREDLNPIDEALGIKELMETYHLTQEDVSRKVGKSRSAIANSVRLLGLSPKIQKLLADKVISQGHARALLSLSDDNLRYDVCKKIEEEDLNVRQTEAYVAKLLKQPKKRVKSKSEEEILRYILTLEKKLSNQLSTKVKIHHGKKKGKIEIEYYSNEDFERIMSLIK